MAAVDPGPDLPPPSVRVTPSPSGRRFEPSPRMRRLALWAGRLTYVGLALVLAGTAAYVSFNLFVRSGVTPVPDLQGLEEIAAADLLTDQGLQLARLPGADDYADSVPAGGILRQEPSPRTLVKRGSTVSIALSLGPQVVSVPDLHGMTVQSSQVTLSAAGLTLGRSLNVRGGRAAPGTVEQQWPTAGSGVPPGSPVDLMINRVDRAEIYLMPELVYRRYEDARRFFQQRGFRLGSVKFEVYEGIPEGVILRQFPLAGHPLRSQDAVSLVVSTTAERHP